MAITISAQMSTNLVALAGINSDMGTTQDRLSTGKKVASVLDGAALYFRAKTLTEKAEALDPVNANISAAISNVKVATKGLDTMYDNLNGLLTTLKDARSKSITPTTAITTVPSTAGNAAQIAAAAAADLRATYAAGTDLVEAAPAAGGVLADPTNSAKFQTGDAFAITFTTGAGVTTTRHFQAGIPTGAPVTRTGLTSTTALTFTDGAELAAAFTTAFGTDDIALTFNATGSTNKFSLTAVNPATTITISQTNNAGTAAVGASNAFLDFDRIFGNSSTRNGGAGLQVVNPGVNTNVNGVTLTGVLNVVGTQVTYAGTGSAATAANLETRRLAADSYKITLLQLANIAKDAYLPGFANLLQGNTMTVDLNEDVGDVVQNVTAGGAVDPLTLGFAAFNAVTGADNSTGGNFNNDTDMNNAVNRVTNALSALRGRQNALGNHTSMLSTRMEFNKSFQTTTNDVASSITAADMTAEAANMAALQNLQAFATNNLSVTKNSEASLIQLLR